MHPLFTHFGIFLPSANAPAFYAGKRTSPLDHTGEANLNRLFPGNQYGSPTEMIAWFITKHILSKVDAIFDLHSAGKSIDHWPSCKIRLLGDKEKDEILKKLQEIFEGDSTNTEIPDQIDILQQEYDDFIRTESTEGTPYEDEFELETSEIDKKRNFQGR